MPDALLLEWEGVLADTGPARRAALLSALAQEHVTLPDDVYDPAWSRLGSRDAAEAALAALHISDATLVELIALRASRAFAVTLGTGISLQPGARAFVERMQGQTMVGIVTRADRTETAALLHLAAFDVPLSYVVCADDVPPSAGHSSTLEHILAQMARRRALQRERVVLLSDSECALSGARASGIRAVAVGVPAHVALLADGSVDGVDGLSLAQIAGAAGVAAVERST